MSERAALRGHRATQPLHTEAAAGEAAPGEPEVEPSSALRPGARLPVATDVGELVRVVDDRQPADRDDAPSPLLVVVDIVDLERRVDVPAVGPELAVRRRAEHDRVAVHRIVDRDDSGAHRSRGGYPSEDPTVEQVDALVDGELHWFGHLLPPTCLVQGLPDTFPPGTGLWSPARGSSGPSSGHRSVGAAAPFSGGCRTLHWGLPHRPASAHQPTPGHHHRRAAANDTIPRTTTSEASASNATEAANSDGTPPRGSSVASAPAVAASTKLAHAATVTSR